MLTRISGICLDPPGCTLSVDTGSGVYVAGEDENHIRRQKTRHSGSKLMRNVVGVVVFHYSSACVAIFVTCEQRIGWDRVTLESGSHI